MKKITTLLMCIATALASIAQNVGIGTNTPNASALLDLQSTNKGLLLPRVADTSSVPSPAKGLVIYSTTANALFYYNGSSWQRTANSGNADLWYKYQDSVLMTDKEYVSINPSQDLQTHLSGLSVNGNLVIQPSVIASKATPTGAQIYTMNNTAAIQASNSSDSVGRLFDPGGQNVNYLNNLQGNFLVGYNSYQAGVSISFNNADFGLESGDTLWIGNASFPACRTDNELMLTNTTSAPSNINLIGTLIYIVFRSNSDGLNSKGFDISWKRIFKDNTVANLRATGFGKALVFNTDDGSFQAGAPLVKIGTSAVCIGCDNAKGNNSFATIGGNAIGNYSVATNGSNANGSNSVAMGGGSSSGENSFSAGSRASASGRYAFAIGSGSQAIGEQSISIGGAQSNGTKAIAIGDLTNALSYLSIALGSYNDTLSGTSKNTWVGTDPLIYVGNGRFNRSNAMVIYKNANVDINGYTRLGKLSEGAPEIKMKELSGTTSSINNGSVSIAHGLNSAKIVSVQALVEYSTGNFVPTAYTYAPELHFNYLVQTGSILVVNNASSCTGTSICNKPVKILITYKE